MKNTPAELHAEMSNSGRMRIASGPPWSGWSTPTFVSCPTIHSFFFFLTTGGGSAAWAFCCKIMGHQQHVIGGQPQARCGGQDCGDRYLVVLFVIAELIRVDRDSSRPPLCLRASAGMHAASESPRLSASCRAAQNRAHAGCACARHAPCRHARRRGRCGLRRRPRCCAARRRRRHPGRLLSRTGMGSEGSVASQRALAAHTWGRMHGRDAPRAWGGSRARCARAAADGTRPGCRAARHASCSVARQASHTHGPAPSFAMPPRPGLGALLRR